MSDAQLNKQSKIGTASLAINYLYTPKSVELLEHLRVSIALSTSHSFIHYLIPATFRGIHNVSQFILFQFASSVRENEDSAQKFPAKLGS